VSFIDAAVKIQRISMPDSRVFWKILICLKIKYLPRIYKGTQGWAISAHLRLKKSQFVLIDTESDAVSMHLTRALASINGNCPLNSKEELVDKSVAWKEHHGRIVAAELMKFVKEENNEAC